MKIDPIWLVQPRADRRAFLMAAGAFVLGGAGGYGLRVLQEPGVPVPAKPEKTGNPELDELRRLAVEAPIAELSAHWVSFLVRRDRTYHDDVPLLTGVRRLSAHCLGTVGVRDRSRMAGALLRSLGIGAALLDPELQALVPELKEAAR